MELLERVEERFSKRRLGAGAPASRPFPDRPPGTDCLPEVRHIVVLMMENHSFDNYLGHLGRGDGLPAGTSNPSADGTDVPAAHLVSTCQFTGLPTQSWDASHWQWAKGENSGFVTAVEHFTPGGDPRQAMGYWTGADLPFYDSLARVFPVADRWFSSCLGPTIPNRRFLVAGTAHGLTTDRVSHCIDYPPGGTVFDALSRYRISWANYHSVSGVRPLLSHLGGWRGHRAARLVWQRLERAVGRAVGRAGGEGERAKSYLQFTADAFPLGIVRYVGHVRTVDRFVADAASGNLPAVSIVDPDFHADSEENPQDISLGEAFSSRVIRAAMHGADWMGTLLVWCYDEHGGYYDHVPPPEAVEPGDRPPGTDDGYRFDQLGFRVPAVIVSPYARPGYVSHVVRDHTSVLKLIERKWNLPPLTARDAAADDLLDTVAFGSPPAFATPPELAEPRRAS
jgi:phospholipase C